MPPNGLDNALAGALMPLLPSEMSIKNPSCVPFFGFSGDPLLRGFRGLVGCLRGLE